MAHPYHLNRLLLVSAFAMVLPACSGVEQQRLEYRQSQSVAPLEMPAGLQAPQSKEALPLHPVNPEADEVDAAPPVNLPEDLQKTSENVSTPALNGELTDEE